MVIRDSEVAADYVASWGSFYQEETADAWPDVVGDVRGNGASLEIDIARWYSLNTELTVHLHREPVGEWTCLDAQTTLSSAGGQVNSGSQHGR